MGLDQNLYTRDGQELIYWRKVNCLHKYFTECALNRDEVDGDNCVDFIIDRADLIELVDNCEIILKAYLFGIDEGNPESEPWYELAESLLPPQSGFFFGSTELDSWYLTDLIDIIKQVQWVLGAYDDEEFVYSAWY